MNSSIFEQRSRFAMIGCIDGYYQPDVFILHGKFFGKLYQKILGADT